jgi:hypothetical protein
MSSSTFSSVPDHSMRTFLAEHELEAQVLAEVARKALRDLGRQFG